MAPSITNDNLKMGCSIGKHFSLCYPKVSKNVQKIIKLTLLFGDKKIFLRFLEQKRYIKEEVKCTQSFLSISGSC